MAGRRYAAFLRGVMPMNAKMPELKRAFEAAGFENVKTVLSSGNVVFSARSASGRSLERRAEAALSEGLGRAFLTIVRSVDELRGMLDADPFARFRLPAGSKRVVTFLRDPLASKLSLPIDEEGTRILDVSAGEVFTAYVPSARGGDFMRVIEKAVGKEVTTRTWETVQKVVLR